eukprot:Amastigsp_a847777_56.p2 type:complete len:125 gc:universal Amastigsp_a847777_56:102-476(+)
MNCTKSESRSSKMSSRTNRSTPGISFSSGKSVRCSAFVATVELISSKISSGKISRPDSAAEMHGRYTREDSRSAFHSGLPTSSNATTARELPGSTAHDCIKSCTTDANGVSRSAMELVPWSAPA